MRKRILVFTICFFFILSFSYSASEFENTFDMLFVKRGTTDIKFTDKNFNETGDPIEFELWPKDESGDNSDPVAFFGMRWQIFDGTSYKIKLNFNSNMDLSGTSMLLSEDGNVANYYAEGTVKIGEVSKKVTNKGFENVTDAEIEVASGKKGEYEMATGQVLFTLTMIPNVSGGDEYFMEGNYTGYIHVTLETS